MRSHRVVSSAVERLVYTEDVGGSKPSPPTSFTKILLGNRLKIRTFKATDDFVSENLPAIRNLLSDAYEDDFSEQDWLHTCNGIRFLGTFDNAIVAHGAVVPREILINGQSLEVGYLEGIAVSREYQGQGIGGLLLKSISDFSFSQYQLSMLSTDEFDFYSKYGWKKFSGKSGVIIKGEIKMTPDEDEGLMYLIGSSGSFEEIHTAYCDFRGGDFW